MCTAIQVALVELLQHWDISPAAVIGHSSGEIAAAYAKGAISREDAWTISYHRGRLSGIIRGLAPHLNGSMMACGLSEEDAKPYVETVKPKTVVVACINSPSSITLSGDTHAMNDIEAKLKSQNIFARKLKVETAYHSPHMEAISDAYQQSLSRVQARTGSKDVRMFSSVHGGLIEGSDLGAGYWVRNMSSPVRISDAAKALINHSDSTRARKRNTKPHVDVFVEVGPHAALQGPLKQSLDAEQKTDNVTYMSVLLRGNDANRTALDILGRLFQKAYPVYVGRANEARRTPSTKPAMLVDLPTFPWNHKNIPWHESMNSKNYRFRKYPRKDLFDAPTQDGVELEPRWRNVLNLSENPWMEDHRVQNTVL